MRYKAIGLKLGPWPDETPEDSADDETKWIPRPVFDVSKGYTLELAGPGGLALGDPLGQIIQVLGARLARTNPLTFEIDIGASIDLGVISRALRG